MYICTNKVLGNCGPKVCAYCSKNMSSSDFLSILGAHQMWSIWWNVPLKVFGDSLWSVQSWQHWKQVFEDAQMLMFLFILGGVVIFNLGFLGHYLTKYICFCAHLKENFLHFSKLTLLLSWFHSWELLRAFKRKNHFCGGHPLAPT